jgi:hypothetical protein
VPRGNFRGNVAGWSRGYLAFAIDNDEDDAKPATIDTSYSPDGLHWSDGPTLAAADAWIYGVSVLEGPAGLLAAGWSGGCGSPPFVESIWLSRDGIHWGEDLGSAFKGLTVLQISAGSAGYFALGYTGAEGASQPAAWTSRDASHWTKSTLTSSVFVNSVVMDGTAFANGYVLVGASWPTPHPLCAHPLSAAVWWSPNGTTWTRAVLPGVGSGGSVRMAVRRITDRELLVIEGTGSGSLAWTSVDGITWTALDAQSADQLARSSVVTDGLRGLALEVNRQDGSVSEIWAVGSTGVRAVAQAGSVPNAVWINDLDLCDCGLGPSGLLVQSVVDGQTWLGIPTA